MENTNTIQVMLEKATEFCNEIECEKNEHGQFIYDSRNKKLAINLPFILNDYKDWLIENKIVKEL